MADPLTAWAQALQVGGLVFEAWGATLLLGEYVGNDFQRVREFRPKRYQDLTMEDTRARERSRFFGLPGVLFLMLGFVGQLVGLTLQTTRSAGWAGAVVVAMLVPIAYAVHRLIRSGTDRPYPEILSILDANARGWFTQNSRRLRCSVCHRRLTEGDCRVWWIVDGGGRASYVHAGHEACLATDRVYAQHEAPGYVETGLSKGVVRRGLSDVRSGGLGAPLDPHDEWSRDLLDRLGIPLPS